ncbi:DUF885 domain-containing protein [Parasphingorhabdus pacifica]
MTTPSELADLLLAVVFDADPVGASLYGYRDRDERLPVIADAAEQAIRARLDGIRVQAMRVDTTRSPLEDRLTLAVVLQQAESMIDRIDARGAEYGIASTFLAPVPGLLMHLGQVPIADAEQASAFVVRLAGIPGFVRAAADRHRAGIAAGRVPVRHLVDAAVEHLDRHLADPAADPLRVPDLHSEALEADRDRVLEERVRPALQSYRNMLADEIAPHARSAEHPGLCWLPEGREIYRLLSREHTTTERDPAELHRTGLALVESIRAECAAIGDRLFGLSDPGEVMRRLRSDTDLRWTDADEALNATRRAVERAEEAAGRWFGRIPSGRCVVEPVPGVPNESTPLAYYMPPAVDGSRPGTFFLNTDRIEQRSRHPAEAVAFHEAVPGHHFQLSLAQQLHELPMLRRLMMATAYAEGWGLYTERLADEMGLYSDDLARLGMVGFEALRAGRLVVDTGLHEFGWSRQQAIDYLIENTPLPPLEVESEVDRYIVYPGQALAYMVGRLEIDRIRAATEQRLGADFDIRAFHDTVLGHGALPLSTLDYLVSEVL